jgi:hypothetical protein
VARDPGKWGRAVDIEARSTAPKAVSGNEENVVEKEDTIVPAIAPEIQVFDLYAVGHNSKQAAIPFIHQLNILDPNGKTTQVTANVDDRALINAMSAAKFNDIKHNIGHYRPSSRLLRMANGVIVGAIAVWEGEVEIEGVKTNCSFEVFDSGDSWEFLFGKPLLKSFNAIHNYKNDTIIVESRGTTATLKNQLNIKRTESNGQQSNHEGEQENPAENGGSHKPKEVFTNPQTNEKHMADVVYIENPEDIDIKPVYVATTEADNDNPTLTEIETDALKENNNVFTRLTDPWKKERVEEILKQVKIGTDLTDEQHGQVLSFLAEWADIFALSVSEVKIVEGAVHRLDIPQGTTFSTKVHQKPLTTPQKRYLYESIDAMLDAGIIEQCTPDQVKCVSPTTLAHKTHTGSGLMLEELQHRVNDECISHGYEPSFSLPPRTAPTPDDESDKDEPKWRICQNFSQINKITKVAPMPQGDIRAKQQRLSGHRYVSGFDFAAGFYAIAVDPESRPYTAFYVEGRGYFWYKRMPFGLTGGPSSFGHMTATRMHELIVKEIMELFVDDGGTADDTFEGMMEKLTKIFTLIRKHNLSLSASKCEFFMSEMVFAGASVGPKGVQPDLSKLTAIVNWKTPEDALALAGFLGLTGWFRDLVLGYAKKEQPLRDLLRKVDMPEKYTKTVYRRIMTNHKLKNHWNEEHTRAFLALKTAMTSEPVLKGPKWDGTPFIITTDGCKDAFGAVLTQRFETVLPSGKVVKRRHPIAFASKRTSKSEEKYKPFLLEFAALKFGLDKFTDIVWGFPIEIETDCQALRDHLLNDKLSATHARWRDGILAHQIIDIRHVPGRINVVADGLSRANEGLPHDENDGSQWTVSEDWEATTGLTHDIFLITDPTSPEVSSLRERFKEEPIFLEVVEALFEIDQNKDVKIRKRARHRASEYLIDDNKLWRVAGGHHNRARTRVECITKEEARELAGKEHAEKGHWGRDAIKKSLMDRIWSPSLDASIVTAITQCGQCKNFGGVHLHALLDPITRRHPFELLVGDYLSMPNGKGGYHTVGLYLDTYSQHVWAFKHKSAGTAKTTVDALSRIFQDFTPAETFMTDGGKHFNNNDVRTLCNKWGTNTHVVPAYSPWVNGLVEGTNKILLHILKRLCAPNLGEDEYEAVGTDDIPKNWPDHLEEAIRMINSRLLPALKYSPKELLLGLVVNTPITGVTTASEPTTEENVTTQMAYVAQQRLDGYAEIVAHAIKRKAAFDKRVLARKPGEVSFAKGQLVQIYRSDLDHTFKTERKLLPKWSPPQRVAEQDPNSYTLERLDGTPIPGRFSARRLRGFIPREGTKLAYEQAEVEKKTGQVKEEPPAEDEEQRDATPGVEEENRGDQEDRTVIPGGEDATIVEGGTWSSREDGQVT